ncbi:hypothetical protein GOV10_03460 [Candidatus Woesearchaeota archaeon]|nr:hypothetical protein [Candidatus Woesearchaeota archaeon]
MAEPTPSRVTREVEEFKFLEEGQHTGVITHIEERKEPFEYLDLVIESDGVNVKAGYSDKLRVGSKLGNLVELFGGSLDVGNHLDLEELFVNRAVTFIIIRKAVKDKGTFSNVIADSVKPVKAAKTKTPTITKPTTEKTLYDEPEPE